MKKRLLFVIDSMICGGGERSLLSLLSALDYSQYEVDLQIFNRGGEFEKYIPQDVNVLTEPEIMSWLRQGFAKQILSMKLGWLLRRIKFFIAFHFGEKGGSVSKRKYWQSIGPCFESNEKEYDAAIGYTQGPPTFYVVDKVKAQKKFAWVNINLEAAPRERNYMQHYYAALDHIVTVSEASKNAFLALYPQLIQNTTIIQDILCAKHIRAMAKEQAKISSVSCPTLVTIGRLEAQKGYDMIMEVSRLLNRQVKDFRWLILGEGSMRAEIEQFVQQNHLENKVFLLGAVANPYPYLQNADVYVQTPISEGFGITIAEARILGRPIVTNEFDAVWGQMVQGKNGIVTKRNAEDVAKAIEKLLGNASLRTAMTQYSLNDYIDSTDEVLKFYEIIEN